MSFDARERSAFDGEPFEVYRWTLGIETWLQASGDTARVVQGLTYEPHAIARSEVSQDGEAGSGNITVTLDLDNPVVQLFRSGPPSQALSLVVLAGHDGEIETGCVFTGRVMSAKLEEACEFTCAPRQAVWKQPVPGLNFQTPCPLRWGSDRCGVNRMAWRVPATLSSASGLTVSSSAFAAYADGHFRGGWIEFGGDRKTITAHVGPNLTLLSALPGLAAGDQVAAFPGCLGTEDDCSGRYGNLPNHLGFKRIPMRQPFDSGGI